MTTYILIGIIVFLLFWIFGSTQYMLSTIAEITIKYHHAREFIVKHGMWYEYNEYCKREIAKVVKEIENA